MTTNDLIDFSLIETHKENIQSLPSGRSARQLAAVLSPTPTPGLKPTDSAASALSPCSDDTKTLNAAIRAEYETELLSIDDSDDPLDIFDRYVKWTLNAYPSAQASPQSQLQPLLERATKTFLNNTHYKNDPRYLKLWLHYIRLFSDAPREMFAFLARHKVGEGLALFYEEFAAWLEGAGRWAQAEEVYKLGVEREARPTERLVRKFGQFERRVQARPQGEEGPRSPALPTVRQALAAKVDPYASSAITSASEDPQSSRSGGGGTGGGGRSAPATSRIGKPKMAIFSDAGAEPTPGTASTSTKGWESIGSLKDRKKENTVEAKPWVGETLKSGKRPTNVQKMEIFKDQNPKSGKLERVFVNLEAVYGANGVAEGEHSFEELRALHRGWLSRDWRKTKSPTRATARKPLVNVSGNGVRSPERPLSPREDSEVSQLADDVKEKVVVSVDETSTLSLSESQQDENVPSASSGGSEEKGMKPKRMKVREIKQEPKTIKTNLGSPTKPKIKRKSSAEPTMTFVSKAAMEEIYDIFNKPLKCETLTKDDTQSGAETDDDDEDLTSAGESTGTGLISGTASEFDEDENSGSIKITARDETQTQSSESPFTAGASEWSSFTASKLPRGEESLTRNESVLGELIVDTTRDSEKKIQEEELKTPTLHTEQQESEEPKTRYIPIPPEDYEAPTGPFRDPEMVAQNRLPFMTPIVEQTESSLAAMTEKTYFNSKTPSRMVAGAVALEEEIEQLLDSSPFIELNTPKKKKKKGEEVIDENEYTPRKKMKHSPSKPDTSLSPSKSSSSKQVNKFSPSRHSPSRHAKKQTVCQPLPSRDGLKGPSSKPPATKTNTYSTSTSKGPIILDARCNPVDEGIRSTILRNVHPPLSSFSGYFEQTAVDSTKAAEIQKYMKTASARKSRDPERTSTQAMPPMLQPKGSSRVYAVKRELGKGAFAPVYLVESEDFVTDVDADDKLGSASSSTSTGLRKDLEALKLEPTSQPWEFYIIRTLHSRLGASNRASSSIVVAHECHVFANEGHLILDYSSQGTMLDLVNAFGDQRRKSGKAGEGIDEVLAMFFTIDLLRFVEESHRVGILHGDLKADNCLVRLQPADSFETLPDGSLAQPYSADGKDGWATKGLMLIDFGRGIDVRRFREDIAFIADWETGPQDCHEMQSMKPWTWQIDYFGLAGTIHTLLYGQYIETVEVAGGNDGLSAKKNFKLKERLKRYWQVDVWDELFELLLNPTREESVSGEAGGKMPLLKGLSRCRGRMERYLEEEGERRGLRAAIRRCELLVGGTTKGKR
ncbi:MAG: hypothetical protein Q9160_006456 [Pyrenula sp. 1 TL-2023]